MMIMHRDADENDEVIDMSFGKNLQHLRSLSRNMTIYDIFNQMTML